MVCLWHLEQESASSEQQEQTLGMVRWVQKSTLPVWTQRFSAQRSGSLAETRSLARSLPSPTG